MTSWNFKVLKDSAIQRTTSLENHHHRLIKSALTFRYWINANPTDYNVLNLFRVNNIPNHLIRNKCNHQKKQPEIPRWISWLWQLLLISKISRIETYSVVATFFITLLPLEIRLLICLRFDEQLRWANTEVTNSYISDLYLLNFSFWRIIVHSCHYHLAVPSRAANWSCT